MHVTISCCPQGYRQPARVPTRRVAVLLRLAGGGVLTARDATTSDRSCSPLFYSARSPGGFPEVRWVLPQPFVPLGKGLPQPLQPRESRPTCSPSPAPGAPPLALPAPSPRPPSLESTPRSLLCLVNSPGPATSTLGVDIASPTGRLSPAPLDPTCLRNRSRLSVLLGQVSSPRQDQDYVVLLTAIFPARCLADARCSQESRCLRNPHRLTRTWARARQHKGPSNWPTTK